jgi:hypothetical protein
MAEMFPLRGSILINGFWRSGTTWVQQVLARSYAAKTIFEPLAPSSQFPLQKRLFGSATPTAWRESFLPLSPELLKPEDVSYLDLAFAGCSPTRSKFPYLCRKSVAECFSRRLVIKCVRAHCLLGYMAERYDVIPIHVSRHPCAVVASFTASDWTWNFDQVDFSHLYPDSQPFEDARAEEERQVLHTYSASPMTSKTAALWALMERRATETPGVVSIRYEDLARNPEQEFRALGRKAGFALCKPLETDEDSPVTFSKRKGTEIEHRLTSWKHELPLEEQNSVRSVVEKIWPAGASLWFESVADGPVRRY